MTLRRPRLAPREVDVIELIAAEGLDNLEVAHRLGMQLTSVKGLLRRIFWKLKTKDRNQLAIYWNCEIYQIGLRALGLLSDVSCQ